jgi:hypothetical protein
MNPGVVVGHLHSDVSSILSLVVQLMPKIVLTAARHDYFGEVEPGFANEVGLLVVVEYGAFELIVVGRVMDGES